MGRISVEALRREQLLDAAIAVVAKKGYEATTIRDVAGAAGVSTGTVNYYFAGRDDLLRSALVEVSHRFQQRIERATAGLGPRDVLDRLIDLSTPSTPEQIDAQIVWGEFWAQAARDEELRALHETLYDGWRKLIAKTVLAGIRQGAFREVDATLWSRQFAALVDGLALHVLLHPRSVRPRDMARACRDHVAATLLP